MELLAAWLLFPLVLGLVSLGFGLLVDRAAGGRLPLALLMPTGLAGLLVVSRLGVSLTATAPLTLPLLLLVALAGVVLGWRRLRSSSLDGWAAAAVLGVALVYGAPILLSGEPTFAGYALLPDTSHQLTLASFLPREGLDWQSLPESSYKLELQKYIGTSYPVAGQAALGVLAPLGVLETAWLYQPFLTFVAASLAASLYGLLGPWVEPRWQRALIAFVAAQPALVVSFALQGSIKEITGCTMIVLTTALAASSASDRWNARALITVGVAAAAALGALGPSAGLYLLLVVAVPAGIWLYRLIKRPSGTQLAGALAVVGLTALLALPTLSSASTAVYVVNYVLSQAEDLGNLAAPLHLSQVSGVWLNGDYRYEPATYRWLNWAAQGFVLGAALLGLTWAVRKRALGPLILAGGIGIGSLYLLSRGSPYADAKVMMVLTPAVLLLAALSPLALAHLARGIPALVLAGLVGGAVLLSNALAYHDVQLAPYDRYNELLSLNERLADRSPVLLNEYDEFSEYLLRDDRPYVQPEWPHGYREGVALANTLRRPSMKTPMDLDDLTTEYLETVPTIVLRRSPTMSRPPSDYRRTWVGRWYELWERRPQDRGTVVAHVPAGRDVFSPGGRVRCREVRRLGARGRAAGARLAFVDRPRLPVLKPLRAQFPAGWYQYGAYPDTLVPIGPGDVRGRVTAPRAGRYGVWLEGSFGRGYEVRIDGRRVGDIRYHAGNPGQYLSAGTVWLDAGRHDVVLRRPGGDLRPGNGGSDSSLRHVGPLVLSSIANERRQVQLADPSEAEMLCGRSVDWIEVVRE